MVCGGCSSYLALSDEDSSIAILNLAYRFANAHVKCGYMTEGQSLDAEDLPVFEEEESAVDEQEHLENP